jgi:hypothetical protein
MAQIDTVYEFQIIGGSLQLVQQNDVAMYGGVESESYSQELNDYSYQPGDLFEDFDAEVSDMEDELFEPSEEQDEVYDLLGGAIESDDDYPDGVISF